MYRMTINNKYKSGLRGGGARDKINLMMQVCDKDFENRFYSL